jgi:hypothetical protein
LYCVHIQDTERNLPQAYQYPGNFEKEFREDTYTGLPFISGVIDIGVWRLPRCLVPRFVGG